MSATYVVIVVVAWVAIGLATGLWMIRRGTIRGGCHRRGARSAVRAGRAGARRAPSSAGRVRSGWCPGAAIGAADGPRALVGLDGSPESERALTTALGFVRRFPVRDAGAGRGGLLRSDRGRHARGTRQRHGTAGGGRSPAASAGVPVRFEVLAGPPDETLRRFAAEEEMDLLARRAARPGTVGPAAGQRVGRSGPAFVGAGAGRGTRIDRTAVHRGRPGVRSASVGVSRGGGWPVPVLVRRDIGSLPAPPGRTEGGCITNCRPAGHGVLQQHRRPGRHRRRPGRGVSHDSGCRAGRGDVVTTSVTPSTAHHGLTAHEVVLLLETDPHRGLSSQEAAPAGGSGRTSCPPEGAGR